MRKREERWEERSQGEKENCTREINRLSGVAYDESFEEYGEERK